MAKPIDEMQTRLRHAVGQRTIMMAGPEGPPGRPESWKCRQCGASVPNKLATCPKCGAGR